MCYYEDRVLKALSVAQAAGTLLRAPEAMPETALPDKGSEEQSETAEAPAMPMVAGPVPKIEAK